MPRRTWRVAPRRESTRDPRSPAAAQTGTVATAAVLPTDNAVAAKKQAPTNPPPAKLARSPQALTPPFVPLLTLRSVVIRIGSDGDRTPTSEDQVSPQQQA